MTPQVPGMAPGSTTDPASPPQPAHDPIGDAPAAILSSCDPADLALPPALAVLRDQALARQREGIPGPPTLALADAAAWLEREPGEVWLRWRGRRTAARLAMMPIDVSAGERIAGRPQLRAPTSAEAQQIEAGAATLGQIPPYPGGDAGHFHPDFDKLFSLGIGGLQQEIATLSASATPEQATFYQSCAEALEGLACYILRVAEECDRVVAAGQASAASESISDDLADLGPICRRIATQPPVTFHEAVQLMFLTIVALWFAEDHGLTAPGRMDQSLRRFYEADLAAGRIDAEQALELISCLYIQFNNLIPAGLALSVMLGGRNRQGQDATCEFTYLCLAARQATQLVYPTVALAWHEGSPAALTDYACRMLRTGIGDPAFFNDELIASGLRQHGVSEADSFSYMNSTCVEIKTVGNAHMWVTAPYINCAQHLLEAIDQVADGDTDAATFADFETVLRDRFEAVVGEAARHLNAIWHQRSQTGCFPLASCLIDDCLDKGLDFDRGGARYNWVENSFVGLANLVDGLITIEHLVYDGDLSMPDLRDILRRNYADAEPLRQRILNRLPSYGNADETADAMAARWAHLLIEITGSHQVGPHAYVPGFFCWVMHGRLGAETGATPDGRKAGAALADGAGSAQGRDRSGPTASALSTTCWDHQPALGGLVHNVRFSQSVLNDEAGLRALGDLVMTYLRRGGFEIQVNVVGSQILRAALANPEEHADLLVRVAGYSDYFVHLDEQLQEEIISRTEHETV